MASLYDRFTLVSDFALAGDQERAIDELTEGLERGDPHQVLLGVTPIQRLGQLVNRPLLIAGQREIGDEREAVVVGSHTNLASYYT